MGRWCGHWLPLRRRLMRLKRSSNQSDSRTGKWVRGRFRVDFEVSSFQPDGSPERWWTSLADKLGSKANRLVEAARKAPVEVEFSGRVSEPGRYGHMGLYQRTFEAVS